MSDNKNELFTSTVDSLMNGMGGMLSTKTVVGDAVHIGDTIILPLVDVSFGMGAGSFASDKKNNSGGGLGGKLSPSAVLVIQGSSTRMVSVKETEKLIDMIPELVDKIIPDSFKKKAFSEWDDETKSRAEDVVRDTISPDAE